MQLSLWQKLDECGTALIAWFRSPVVFWKDSCIMTFRTMNSRNVTTNDFAGVPVDGGTGRAQPREKPNSVGEVGVDVPELPDPQLRFDFAEDEAQRIEEQNSLYETLGGTDDALDRDDRVIMVVDDDHAIREALKDLLGILGFSVVSARDGEDALAMLGDGCKPSAILLDLGMPRMDGWRFRSELLSDPRYADLRVIVITASEDQHPEALGVTDVLTKPVPLRRLVEVLTNQDC